MYCSPSVEDVLAMLTEVDIFGLLKMGAPKDEYLPEAELIVDYIEERGAISVHALDVLLERPSVTRLMALHSGLTRLYEQLNRMDLGLVVSDHAGIR